MGRQPATRSQAGETMSCTRAITPSRSLCEEVFKGLHNATLGSKGIPDQEHRGSALEAWHLNESVNLRRGLSKGLFGQQRSEGKQSSINIPSFEAFATCSPSESFTSSKVLKHGFSSSSSASSFSSFNEAGSFVVEEFSPASVTSAEVKQAECSPSRRRLHRISLAPRLAATVAPSKKWDDTNMHCKCSSSPAPSSALKAKIPDHLHMEDNLPLEGSKARRQLCSRNRNDNRGFHKLDYAGCDKGDKITSYNINADVFSDYLCAKSQHYALERPFKISSKVMNGKEQRDGCNGAPAFFPQTSNLLLSHRKRSIISNSPANGINTALHGVKCTPSGIRESHYNHKRGYSRASYNNVPCETRIDGLSERFNAGSRLRKDSTTTCDARRGNHPEGYKSMTRLDGRLEQCSAGSKPRKNCTIAQDTGRNSRLEGHESIKVSMQVKADAQSTPICALECSSTPYEADIGVDTLSLQLHTATALSSSEKTKLSSGSTLHQPVHTNERKVSFQTAVTPKPKLDAQRSTPSHHFERGMTCKMSTAQCTSTDVGFEKRKEASHGVYDMGSSTREAPSGFSDREPSSTQDLYRSYAIMHPVDHVQKGANAPFYIEALKPPVVNGKVTEEADTFTLHSPLLPEELKYLQSSSSTLNPPVFPATSKVLWDWRSKSMGAKASLKSAVRNLEATLTGSRSVSLSKTRSRSQKDTSKTESARLLERVFVSPIKARSKQVGFPRPIERPGKQSNEVKEIGVFQSRDAKSSTSNVQSHAATACAPPGFAIRPFPSSAYKEVQVTCKPFLPSSRSVRHIPESRGVLGIESLTSSGHKAVGSSSDGAPLGILHAQLQCILKDGLPFYTMTVEGSEEMLLARACLRENHSSKEGCRWQYSFHSGQGKARGTGGSNGWRSWIKKESKAVSGPSGIMNVSNVFQQEVTLATKEVQPLNVLEFVLYDGRGPQVAHSQSLRYCATEKLCQKSAGLSPSSFLYPASEYGFSSSPSHSDMQMTSKQHVRSLTDLSSEGTNTPFSVHKGIGGHRPSMSLDVWSDLDVPESTQMPGSCSPSHVELAALVIQVSPESHQRDSNASGADHMDKSSEGWGLKVLDGDIVSELRSGLPHIHAAEAMDGDTRLELRDGFSHMHAAKSMNFNCDALVQAGLGTSAELLKLPPIDDRSCVRINRGGLHVQNLSVSEVFQDSSGAETLARQGSLENVTLLLPTGDHGFPNRGTRGPSSLIERWRSGGSCECGGWDLGCGIKVINSGSPMKKCMMSTNKHTNAWSSYDQQFNLFAQGSKQELMLSLFLVKQGEFKLSFQGQLSPLKAFATAVAMLHSHEPIMLPMMSSPTSSLTTSTS